MILAVACKNNDSGDDKSKRFPYSIFIGNFKNLEDAVSLKSKLSRELLSQSRIEKLDEENFQLLYGNYSSSYEAGKTAFEFYRDSLIPDYKIVRSRNVILDEYANVLFVARFEGRLSVFSFNLISKKIYPEWSRWGRKVVSLNLSKDNRTAFITTALGYGRHQGISYVHEARVFLLKREEEQTDELAELGNGVQLYTYWEKEDLFNVNFSSIDSIYSNIVLQNILSFDKNGKITAEKKRNFDLLKQGFPFPPDRTPVYFSSNKRFQLRTVYSQGESFFYVKDLKEHSEELIASSKNKIFDCRWSDDGNYLFIVNDNSAPKSNKRKSEPTGELIVIDAVQKKAIKIFQGFRFENLLVHGKLLFFDKRLTQVAQIAVYDFAKNEIYYTISVEGGCGLNNLPM